jgi:hypothetical protein
LSFYEPSVLNISELKERQAIRYAVAALFEKKIIPENVRKFGITVHLKDEFLKLMNEATDAQCKLVFEEFRKEICT